MPRLVPRAVLLGLLPLALFAPVAPAGETAPAPPFGLPLQTVARQLGEIGIAVTTGAAPGYVEDAACASCHRAIAASYREKGMARAFSRPGPAGDGEDFAAPPFVHVPSGQILQMVRRGSRLVFRRWQADGEGKPLNVFEQPVDWVLGSGDHARVYLYRTAAGEIYQLPLAWYSQTRSWGMAPGYDRPDHDGVVRRVRRECLFCHTAYPDLAAGADSGGAPPLFPARLPEGIGCQRCHGPGADHVWLASGGIGVREEIRASIFNPGRLPAAQRDEVCLGCHLQPSVAVPGVRRFGRGDFSFRPGEPLPGYLVQVDVEEDGRTPADRFEINHHPYRLRQSRCYLESGGALSCLTCHSPHRRLADNEKAAHFQAACLTCHRPDACNRPRAARDTKPGDCASCHMAKRRTQDVVRVVMTDHLIRRRPGGPELLAPLQESEPELTGVRLTGPDAPGGALGEVYRADAVVRALRSTTAVDRLEKMLNVAQPPEPEPWLDLAQGQLGLRRFADAERTVTTFLERHPAHPQATEWLALAHAGQGKTDDAIALLRQTLALGGDRPEAEFNLGLLLAGRGLLGEAEPHLQRAVTARPNLVAAWYRLGEVQAALGRPSDAAASYRRALEIDPRHTASYLALGKLLLAQGNRTKALRWLRHGAQAAARPDEVTAALRAAERTIR